MASREYRAPGEHSKPEVKKALQLLHTRGWSLVKSGHWGWALCPHACQCKIRIDGTPKNPGNHAKDIVRKARKCSGWVQ